MKKYLILLILPLTSFKLRVGNYIADSEYIIIKYNGKKYASCRDINYMCSSYRNLKVYGDTIIINNTKAVLTTDSTFYIYTPEKNIYFNLIK